MTATHANQPVVTLAAPMVSLLQTLPADVLVFYPRRCLANRSAATESSHEHGQANRQLMVRNAECARRSAKPMRPVKLQQQPQPRCQSIVLPHARDAV